ncbi:MAG: hypothetical protein H6Q90_852 [Deltaproteobacteria bacterium]|nr:hypothetical protein [Deltaproteobacteria bacterium]
MKLAAMIAIALSVTGCAKRRELAAGLDPSAGFGPPVSPPGGLRVGMTVDEARAAMPALATRGDELVADLPAGALLVKLERGRVHHLVAMFEPRIPGTEITSAFTRRWGAPHSQTSSGPMTTLGWQSEASGWRATLECIQSPAMACSSLQLLPYRPLQPGYFGKAVAPPGPLASVRIGMTVDEAKAVLPELTAPAQVDAQNRVAHVAGGLDEVVGNLWFTAGPDKAVRIHALSLDLPGLKLAETAITRAWGPGTPGSGKPDETVRTWSDAATGWQAELVHRTVHADAGELSAAELRFSTAAVAPAAAKP